MNRVFQFAAASLVCMACASAQAVSVTLAFAASGFGVGAPADPVSGSFTYDAASISSTINAMQSVSLSIGGHAYTLAQVSYASPYGGGNIDMIYGTLNSILLATGTDDFALQFDRVTGAGVDFTYTSFSSASVWHTSTFSSVTRTAVPEPATLALAALALTAAALSRRRRA